MTFTFKLSRRLARLRAVPVLAALVASISCSGENLNDPSSSTADPTAVTIFPDSASIAVDSTTQFDADTSSGDIAASRWRWIRRYHSSKLSITPQATTLRTGARQAFTATTASAAGNPTKAGLDWSATGGRIDEYGRYTAGKTPGRFHVIVTTANGLSDTAAVNISPTAPPPPSGASEVVLTPAKATIKSGASLTFTAEGKAADGTPVNITPQFTATGGSITATGKFTAPSQAGDFDVIATDPASGKADTSNVTVTANAPTLDRVVLTPGSASVTAGDSKQFDATGMASDGSAMPITPSFTATGGTISSSGLFKAGAQAGTFRVVASASGKADTSTVTVTPAPSVPTLTGLVLTPASVSLNAQETAKFAAKGVLSDGTDTTVTVTFTATGGSITSNGAYTAGSSAGNYKVFAKLNGGTLADTSSVTVTVPNPDPNPNPNPNPDPNPGPPPTASGCVAVTRTVNVSNVGQLTSAISSAQPGDCILMAPGTYNVNANITQTAGGTSSRPVTVRGSGSSTVVNLGPSKSWNADAPYVHYRNFRLTNTFYGFYSHGAVGAVWDSMEVDNTQQSAIALEDGSNGATVARSYIHDTGKAKPQYGEGVYVGGYGAVTTDVKVIGNRFECITAEMIDNSAGADRMIAQGNKGNGSCNVFINGTVVSLFASRGDGVQFLDNTLSEGNPHGIVVWSGSHVVLRGNNIDLENQHDYPGIGIDTHRVSDAVVGCDNVVTAVPSGGTALTAKCTN